MHLPPKDIALTATQTGNDVKICWNWPFGAARLKNKLSLHWSNNKDVLSSADTKDFKFSKDVTHIKENCLTVAI